MKKMNRKGFTIVELVIVIAVIAILAAVLIPTFSGIVEKAQESAEVQKVTNEYKEAYAEALLDNNGTLPDSLTGVNFTFALTIDDGAVTDVDVTSTVQNYGFTIDYSNGAFTADKQE